MAEQIGSHKGHVPEIENDRMNPPSVKIVQKFARLFGQNGGTLARLARVDKAPAILREDAEHFLERVRRKAKKSLLDGGSPRRLRPFP